MAGRNSQFIDWVKANFILPLLKLSYRQELGVKDSIDAAFLVASRDIEHRLMTINTTIRGDYLLHGCFAVSGITEGNSVKVGDSIFIRLDHISGISDAETAKGAFRLDTKERLRLMRNSIPATKHNYRKLHAKS